MTDSVCRKLPSSWLQSKSVLVDVVQERCLVLNWWWLQGGSTFSSKGPAFESCQLMCPSLSVERCHEPVVDADQLQSLPVWTLAEEGPFSVQESRSCTFVSTHCYMVQTFDVKHSEQSAVCDDPMADMEVDTDECNAVPANPTNNWAFHFHDGEPVHAGIHGQGHPTQVNAGNCIPPSPGQQRVLTRLHHLESASQSPLVSHPPCHSIYPI